MPDLNNPFDDVLREIFSQDQKPEGAADADPAQEGFGPLLIYMASTLSLYYAQLKAQGLPDPVAAPLLAQMQGNLWSLVEAGIKSALTPSGPGSSRGQQRKRR